MEDLQINIDAEVQFEQHYAEVLAFVKKMNHASCFELMKEFHINYAASVDLMDLLETRGIVDVATEKGSRPLLTDEGRELKKKRQRREREERIREAEKLKEIQATSPQGGPPPTAFAPMQPVRSRTVLRKKS